MTRQLLLLIALVLVAPTSAFGEMMAVEIFNPEDQSVGRGLALGSFNRCLILAPYHVIEAAVPFQVTFPSGQRTTGELFWDESERNIDLGLLLVESNAECARANIGGEDIPRLLASSSDAILHTQGPDLLQRAKVFVSRVEVDLVTFDLGDSVVREGYSGSALVISGKPVGILLRVETDARRLVAFRLDRALEILSPALREPGVSLSLTVSGRNVRLPATFGAQVARYIEALHPDLSVTTSSGATSRWTASLEVVELRQQIDKVGRETVAGRIYSSQYSLGALLTLTPSGGIPVEVALNHGQRKNTHTIPREPALTAQKLTCSALAGNIDRILQVLGLDYLSPEIDCSQG